LTSTIDEPTQPVPVQTARIARSDLHARFSEKGISEKGKGAERGV
jgi:hypothetical protein